MKAEALISSDVLNKFSSEIISCAIEVHRNMGPGLLESIYQQCMMMEMRSRGMRVDTLIPVKLYYKSKALEKNFVIDMMVESEIILELKAVEDIYPVHHSQLLSYLKLSGKRLGFIINFNVPLLKEGIKRMVHNF